MLAVLKTSWALFLAIMLAAIGAGLLTTLVGVRGTAEGFSPFSLSLTHAAFYLGYALGGRFIPELIVQVGRIRVFAALASIASVIFLLYSVLPTIPAWVILRVISGFCYSGCLFVVVGRVNMVATAVTTNQIIFIYLFMQMMGVVIAISMLNVTTADEFVLFLTGSIILSVAFVPMMLSMGSTSMGDGKDKKHQIKFVDVTPMGAVAIFRPEDGLRSPKRMDLGDLMKIAPLGTVGIFLRGGLVSTLFTMAVIFGLQKGLSIAHLAIFISAVYIGAVMGQYPIGWLATKMDKRWLIVAITAIGAGVCWFGTFIGNDIILLASVGIVFAGTVSPLYSLYVTHNKNILGEDVMNSAFPLLGLINAIGAIIGTMVVGAFMTLYGADAYFIYIASLMGLIAVFTLYHIIRGAGVPVKET